MPNKLIALLQQLIETRKTSTTSLAELLNISRDAVYKKLNGKSPFLFEEVLMLQQQFGFSLDDLAEVNPHNKIRFAIKEFNKLDTPEATLRQYVQLLAQDLLSVVSAGIPHLYYAAKDLPLFCFFSSATLTRFKLYFWYITLFDSASKPFAYKHNWLPQDIVDTALQLFAGYEHIHSTEIWNQETINSTLHQIEYCTNTGLIEPTDAQQILQALYDYIEQLDQYAAQESKKGASIYKLYFNEVLILDNTVLFEIGDFKLFYMPLQTLNFLSNTEPAFTTKMYDWLHKQIKKSTLISGEAEKERTRFIGNYKKLIHNLQKKIDSE